jgi:hypothetical protein
MIIDPAGSVPQTGYLASSAADQSDLQQSTDGSLARDNKCAYYCLMTTLAELSTHVAPAPEALYARWTDVETHPQWSPDLVWSHLEEPLALGARGRLKPKGGPTSRFAVTELVEGRTFADTTYLPGARLTFRHDARPNGTGSDVHVTVTLEGPLRWLWARILKPASVQQGIEGDLANLVSLIDAGAGAVA